MSNEIVLFPWKIKCVEEQNGLEYRLYRWWFGWKFVDFSDDVLFLNQERGKDES